MKTIKYSAFFILIAVMAVFAGDKKTVDLKIDGMTCGACVEKVKSAIEKVDGVTGAEVVLATNSATVTYEAKKADEAKITKAVNDTGFKVVDNSEKKSEKAKGSACCGSGSGECCANKTDK